MGSCILLLLVMGDLNVKWELNCVVHLRVDTYFSLSYLQTYNICQRCFALICVEKLRKLSSLINWNREINSQRYVQ